MGVFLETDPRLMQQETGSNSFRCSINPDWLQKLDLDEQGAATLHSFSLGVHPVVVQNPAIIIQPMSIIEEDGGEEDA